jgi:hypothetical protein
VLQCPFLSFLFARFWFLWTTAMSDASDAGSEVSLSSSSRSSSIEVAAPPIAHGFATDAVRGEPAEVTRLRLQREQKLRRLLSQRHLGQPEPVAHGAFFCTRSVLGEEDLMWLYTLTNHRCFAQLMQGVRSTPSSSLAGHLDALLSDANPLFHFSYRMSIEAPHDVSAAGDNGAEAEEEADVRRAAVLRESPFMHQWSSDRYIIQRKRPEREESHATTSGAGTANLAESARKSVKGNAAASASASSGLVAQSMVAWEAHLTESLKKEGDTIDNFRHSRSKSSYTEKKYFQQQAEWNEFAREVALQRQQRDREATRALRRGEADE